MTIPPTGQSPSWPATLRRQAEDGRARANVDTGFDAHLLAALSRPDADAGAYLAPGALPSSNNASEEAERFNEDGFFVAGAAADTDRSDSMRQDNLPSRPQQITTAFEQEVAALRSLDGQTDMRDWQGALINPGAHVELANSLPPPTSIPNDRLTQGRVSCEPIIIASPIDPAALSERGEFPNVQIRSANSGTEMTISPGRTSTDANVLRSSSVQANVQLRASNGGLEVMAVAVGLDQSERRNLQDRLAGMVSAHGLRLGRLLVNGLSRLLPMKRK